MNNHTQIPIIEKFLHEEPSLSPEAFFGFNPQNLEKKKMLQQNGIDTCILLFCADENLKKHLQQNSTVFFELNTGSAHEQVLLYQNKVLLFFAQIGGPQAAADIEEISFFGITKFVCVGSCGLLTEQPKNHVFLVEKAIRDEGASYHYLPPSLYVETDQHLTNQLATKLDEYGFEHKRVITWTTDAFYRETKSLVELRVNQGATTVEMECASFAAVCKRKGFAFAQILYSTDSHNTTGEWKWHFDNQNRKTVLEQLFEVCLLATTKS